MPGGRRNPETPKGPLGHSTHREIRAKYRKFAPWYDWLEGLPERILGGGRVRRRLLSRASGRILEVAAGTGANLPYMPSTANPVLSDLSRAMLTRAVRKAEKLGVNPPCVQAAAEALPFPDGNFDTVVSVLSLCTIPSPVAALREFGRVCRSDGRILLFEHGAGNLGWLVRFQDRRAARHARALGCWWNRRHDRLVREAGLRVIEERRRFLGVLYEFALAPGPGQ
jgi:ubiquinone/menaquinone biosynthesis C-methylase UbiE